MPLLPRLIRLPFFPVKKFCSQKENVDFEKEFVVDPYSVVNKSTFLSFAIVIPIFNLGGKAIDYDRLIKYFGCARITPDLLAR